MSSLRKSVAFVYTCSDKAALMSNYTAWETKHKFKAYYKFLLSAFKLHLELPIKTVFSSAKHYIHRNDSLCFKAHTI